MHVAALEQHEEACVLLAEAGASVDVKNAQGEAVADMIPERVLQRPGGALQERIPYRLPRRRQV